MCVGLEAECQDARLFPSSPFCFSPLSCCTIVVLILMHPRRKSALLVLVVICFLDLSFLLQSVTFAT